MLENDDYFGTSEMVADHERWNEATSIHTPYVQVKQTFDD